ncbi:MAG: type II secretion system F family protein [Pseudomonadota bacterium]
MSLGLAAILLGFGSWLALRNLDFSKFTTRTCRSIHHRIEINSRYRSHLTVLLERAGTPGKESRFILRQIFAGIGGLVFGVLLTLLGSPTLLPITLGVLGVLWPRLQLRRAIQKRQRSILLNLPYYLDLITLALEAGLDLIAAIEEVIVRDRPNPLREEFEITLRSIRVGATRSRSFARLAERTGVAPLQLLSTSVSQSEELGSSLGGLLRLQSESLRRELYRQAEETAQRAPIKLLAPLIGLIFPVVFLLLFAPLAIRFFS